MSSYTNPEYKEKTTEIFSSLSVLDLKKYLLEHGIKTTGKRKAELVDMCVDIKIKELQTEPGGGGGSDTSSQSIFDIKEELIITLMIISHGTEYLTTPWPKNSKISKYFKKNVRVCSRACVPDTYTLTSGIQRCRNINRIHDASIKFLNKKDSITSPIIDKFISDNKSYYKEYLDDRTDSINNDPDSDVTSIKTVETINKERTTGLSSFLSNKEFDFHTHKDFGFKDSDPDVEEYLAASGCFVIDIRSKITNSDGIVSYKNIYSTQPITSYKMLYNTNIRYSEGLINILKILGKEHLVSKAKEILLFKDGDREIFNISLEQLYNFFTLIGISYVNIIDNSCRSNINGPILQEISDIIYKDEQKYAVKPDAFGKHRNKKRSLKLIKNKIKKYSRRK